MSGILVLSILLIDVVVIILLELCGEEEELQCGAGEICLRSGRLVPWIDIGSRLPKKEQLLYRSNLCLPTIDVQQLHQQARACIFLVPVRTYIFCNTNFVIMQEENTKTVNFKSLREEAGMTLSQLSELSGYSIPSINGLELNNIGSKRLRDRVLSILLQKSEEGEATEAKHWRDRALKAEDKLEQLKSAMSGWIKKI